MIPIDRGGGGYQKVNDFRRPGFVGLKRIFLGENPQQHFAAERRSLFDCETKVLESETQSFLSRGTSFGAGRRGTGEDCGGLTASSAARRSPAISLATGLRIGRRRT